MTLALRNRLDLRWLIAPLAVVALLIVTHAALAFQGDGRINLDGYMGGDSVYCVDGNMNPTGEPVGAGIRLLNLHGEQLMVVSPEQIATVPHNPVANTLIAQGNGSYGPIYLERLTSGQFQLIGTDDHGKTFFFTWTDCTQITPIPNGHSSVSQGGGNSSLLEGLKDFCHKAYDNIPDTLSQCLGPLKQVVHTCEDFSYDLEECISAYLT